MMAEIVGRNVTRVWEIYQCCQYIYFIVLDG